MRVLLLLMLALSAQAQEHHVRQLISASSFTEAEKEARSLLASATPESDQYAALLELLADVRSEAGAPSPEVESLANQALALRTKLHSATDPSLALSLNTLGAHHLRATDYRKAREEFDRALKLQESPAALNGLATATRRLGDPKQALALHERALARAPNDPAILHQLGEDLFASADLKRAEDSYNRALEIYSRDNDPESIAVAQVLASIATLYKERGEFSRALPLHERTVRIFETRLGPNHAKLVAQYNNLALAQKALGDYDHARPAMEHALDLARTTYGPEASPTAQVLGNFAIILRESGDLLGARDAYQHALTIQEKLLGPAHYLVGAIRHSLAIALTLLGETTEAEASFRSALAILEKAQGPEGAQTIEAVSSLGNLLVLKKKYTEARALLERSWNSNQRKLGDNNLTTASSLQNLATLQRSMGDLASARTNLSRAIQVQQTLRPKSPRNAESEYQLGFVALSEKKYQEADRQFEKAASLWTEGFGKDYFELSETLAQRALALEALGRRTEALTAALESARIRRENIILAMRGLSERQALLYASKERQGFSIALDLVTRGGLSPQDRAKVWNAAVHERAIVLDELAQRNHTSPDPNIAQLTADLAVARERVARAVVQGADKDDSSFPAKLKALRDKVEQHERDLARASASFRQSVQRERADLASISSSLGTRTALISYVRSPNAYVAFLIRSGGKEPVAIRLGSATQIDSLVDAWRKEINRESTSLGRNAEQNEAAYRTTAEALRRAVWDPIALQTANTDRVYLVPDGKLQLVNFAALPQGEKAYLGESRASLHLFSAESDLLMEAKPTKAGGLLAVANPAFRASATLLARVTYRGVHSNCNDFSRLDFPDLPGSAAEVRAIEAMWNGQGTPGSALYGPQATESAVKEQAPGHSVIHLATHGFFFEDACTSQADLLENPLLRSGLAFAGAANRANIREGQDDGILTAAEIASMNLEGAQWVVLSGCDTGLGVVDAGEGVLGLRRAFRIAGAQTLISSLWPVSDEAARQWMVRLYRERFTGKSTTSQAVRKANIASLTELRRTGHSTHPFYWAGFIAVGADTGL